MRRDRLHAQALALPFTQPCGFADGPAIDGRIERWYLPRSEKAVQFFKRQG